MNFASTSVSHFATISVRPGSALVGGLLENIEYAERIQGCNVLKHRNAVRRGAFHSHRRLGVLIYINAKERVVISGAS